MAWNRASEAPKVAPKKSPSKMRGVVAGVVTVCALGGLCLWMFSGGEDAPKAKVDKDRGLIKEVTPAAAPKVQEKELTNAQKLQKRYPLLGIPDDWDKPYPPQAYWPDGRLKEHTRYVKVITNHTQHVNSIEKKCFKHKAERDIARALMARPGSIVVGNYEYGEAFTESFLESLKEEVKIDPEKDTPAMQDLKRMVIETKKDLKARYDAGEDIAAVMTENRKQLKELALYKSDILKLVEKTREEHGENMTEQDEKDLISAVNLMLEDRGCEPLVLPNSFVEQAKHLTPDGENQGGNE